MLTTERRLSSLLLCGVAGKFHPHDAKRFISGSRLWLCVQDSEDQQEGLLGSEMAELRVSDGVTFVLLR